MPLTKPQAFSALLVLFVLAAPPLVFEKSLGAFQAATVISGMYSLYILVLSGIHGRESAGILLRGFLFLFIFFFWSKYIGRHGMAISALFGIWGFYRNYLHKRDAEDAHAHQR